MLYDMKDAMVGANHRVRIPEVMELAIKLELKNKKKVKVNHDRKDIFKGRGLRVRKYKVEDRQDA